MREKKNKVENKEERDRNAQSQPCSQASESQLDEAGHTEGKEGNLSGTLKHSFLKYRGDLSCE